MSIKFSVKNKDIFLIYSPDGPDWLKEKLISEGFVNPKKIFYLSKKFLEGEIPDNDKLPDFIEYTFRFAKLEQDYWKIDRSILDTKYDVRIYKDIINIIVKKIEYTGVNNHFIKKLTINKIFISERNISVFKRIDKLCDEQISIGGEDSNAIPVEDFFNLIKHFPTTYEIDLYADARVSNVLKDFLPTMSDGEKKLQNYFKKKKRKLKSIQNPENNIISEELYDIEMKKYLLIRDALAKQLSNNINVDEKWWQEFLENFLLLIYPSYIAILKEVKITDPYSRQNKITWRYIDFVLVDKDGFIDIIEIKRPFPDFILSRSTYRDNYYPKQELTGAVLQAEKYLFYLNSMSTSEIGKLSEKYKKLLPERLTLKIRNPRANIILGRSNKFDDGQRSDFEMIKRQYSRIVDILSYDDLLSRLTNVIESLKIKKHTFFKPEF